MEKVILVDEEIKKIQQIRSIEALEESDWKISISSKEVYKFKILKKKFGEKYLKNSPGDLNFSELLKIDHSTPSTGLYRLQRTLLFPHSIYKYLKSKWPSNRTVQFSFSGLLTEERKVILADWITKNQNKKPVHFPDEKKFFNKMKSKIFSAPKKIENVHVWSSKRGRKYPTKAWDEKYYQTLLNSQFVLCPAGVHTWSYRFFESALCGAIPVVEENCEAYKGFKFHLLKDDPKRFKWNKEDAEYNFKLCIERTTIPLPQINEELKNFAQQK